jgi:replicative DNA helicase
MLKSCEQLLKDGKIKEFEEELTDELYSLKAKSQVINMHTYTMEKLEEDIKSTKDGLITGFPSIDSFITIPQGAITVIAGRPSHGKTTLMMNLFINMLKTYYNKSFLFFSYEESKRQIGLKILTILSEEILDTDKNISHLNNYIKTNNYNNHSINKAKKLFKTFSDSGRMWIIDEPYYVDNLNEVLISLQQKLDIGAVFIDYIQKIKIKGKYYSRQVELQKVSERILETAIKMDIPIIMGAQFNRDVDCADKVKLGNLREAGDIEQDANLVIGIWNYSMENSENNGNNSNGKIESEIEISILKNRNGIANKKVKLILNKPILTIKELPTTKW